MTIHQIVLAIISALNPPDAPADKDDQPKFKIVQDHFFCCNTVDHLGGGSGEGCVTTSVDHTKSCASVLVCPFGYTESDGVTHCTYPPED